jgi:hypothetical protein
MFLVAKQAQVLVKMILRLAVRVPGSDLRHGVVLFAATKKLKANISKQRRSDLRCTMSCTQPLYTTKVVILSAATSPLLGRQGDAFGVVVGKLTKKYGSELTWQ